MILESVLEFRGYSVKNNENGVFTFINLEDDTGEACKFSCASGLDISLLQKGDKAKFVFDYNVKYKSLKVVNYEV